MTNEEARKRLLDWIQYATDPERVPFMDEPCSDEEIILAMRIGADALSHLPSNLDEAAEEYALDVKAKPFGNLVKEAFKAGAEWMAEQGETKEAVIGMATEEISINVSQQTLDELDLCPGDKVVVQIRKK